MVINPEQQARNAAGLARCREVVDAVAVRTAGPADEPVRPLTRSEEIRRAALARAAAERRRQRGAA